MNSSFCLNDEKDGTHSVFVDILQKAEYNKRGKRGQLLSFDSFPMC